MGGGGGGSYFPSSAGKLRRLIAEARQQVERDRLDSEVNQLLQQYLITFNDRDADKTREYLDRIEKALGKDMEVEQLLLGGSVAKHTYVDGLSDVDALVILNKEDLGEKPPGDLLKAFSKTLEDKLTYDIIADIKKGTLAVTVTHRDGTEIQLLPAMRQGKKIIIPDSACRDWQEINPKAFQKALTAANQRLNNMIVPTIKLAKSVNSNLPARRQLGGYHIEALAMEVFKNYDGPKTPRAMLTHFFEEGSKRLLQPIADVTGQSLRVDAELGKSHSPKRRLASERLVAVARRIKAASTIEQWKRIIEG